MMLILDFYDTYYLTIHNLNTLIMLKRDFYSYIC